MFAITGITGNVGGAVGRTLLATKKPVRAVVRDVGKAAAWGDRGCEVALADIEDTKALAAAFRGAEGVFIVVPSNFDPQPGFLEAHAIAAKLKAALDQALPTRVVYLSTVGAQAIEPNLLTQHSIIERALGAVSLPITFLRPAWFLENSKWDVDAAKAGVIPSYLQPLNRALPMVATADIGQVAAELLQETWTGHRIVELEGPQRVSPNLLADGFSELLHHAVRMDVVPRDAWEANFLAQGMKNPTPRIKMLDGFNDGWIKFEGNDADIRKGKIAYKEVLKGLLNSAGSLGRQTASGR